MTSASKKTVITTVIIGALGYFVDIYDLLLFGIVRTPSLRAIGVPETEILNTGIRLINAQMSGMLLGGILWGIIGDKRGRVSVLFGSIFMYSVANIANAFVTTPTQYAILRFIAGIGLAGELGAAITLVAEVMPKDTRGFGTTVVASVGILGAVAAALIGDAFSWKTAYIIGGALGFMLLILRVKLLESGLFEQTKSQSVRRGNFFALFKPFTRLVKYASCIGVGLPVWFAIGVLITFSPELAKALGVVGEIKGGSSIMYAYIGLSLGDLASGLLSQVWKSRKNSIALFLGLTLLSTLLYVFGMAGASAASFYGLCVLVGFSVGYWAVFVTNASEQFGTNLRATAATTVPNFVRGGVVPITLAFSALKVHVGLPYAALTVGIASLLLAAWSWSQLAETHGKDLNYFEAI